MFKIPTEWLFLLLVVVSAEVDEYNESFEKIDISNKQFSDTNSINLESIKDEGNGNSQEGSNVPESSMLDMRSGRGRHSFFRMMDVRGRSEDTRRVFGGEKARLEDFPAICILFDRFMGAHCTGSVLTPYWVLTAAHCITPNLGYVKYNTRTPMRSNEGQIVPIRYLYKHPYFKVVQADLGRGLDVTVLHHDIGLAQTRSPMILALRSSLEPLQALMSLTGEEIKGEEVQVLGYGRTELREKGEELLSVYLKLVDCQHTAWKNCMCGEARALDQPSGVCSGDSGGPVVFRGVQVGVTSMGPLECASKNTTWWDSATSVFTALFPYRHIINHTVLLAESQLRAQPSSLASPGSAAHSAWLGITIVLLVS